MKTIKNTKKVCSFYVSDLHLITMLLPYLDAQMKNKDNFIVITQKNLEKEVKLVLSKLTLNEESKNKLINIDWNNKDISDFKFIEERINKMSENGNLNIIINGNKDYIEVINNKLKTINLNNIKTINCYDITQLDEDIKDILKEHDSILNTSGEKYISEVFEGYEKRKYA